MTFAAQEDLTHNTGKLLKKIKSIPVTQQTIDQKPKGFWYSCNDEWLKWVRAEMPQWEGKRNYKIELDYANVLAIRNYKQLRAFHKKYAAPVYSGDLTNGYIDWRKVAETYKGIEICPYLYKARFDREIFWYYGWDVASGCIWDASAVKSIELMPSKEAKKKQLQEKKLNFGLSSPKPLSASAKRKKMKKDMGIVDFKSLIKEMIELICKEAISKPEANKNDIFGQYLFAPERDDVPKPPEENTDREEALLYSLGDHYEGTPSKLSPWIKALSNLKNQGKYTKVLSVPPKYKHAYRFMTIKKATDLQKMLAGKKVISDNKWHVQNGGTFFGNFKEYGKTRKHFSWTVNPNVIKEIQKDWGEITFGIRSGWFVVMKASTRNNFLLNPDILKKSGIPGDYAYQEEVISVGDIKLDKIAYISFSTEEDPYSDDWQSEVDVSRRLATGAVKQIKQIKPAKKK